MIAQILIDCDDIDAYQDSLKQSFMRYLKNNKTKKVKE